MDEEARGVYIEGDPNTESTRRHMERVLRGERTRRWTWVLGALAGGTALAFWRIRQARHREDQPARPGDDGGGGR
jgi:hypothetical protein